MSKATKRRKRSIQNPAVPITGKGIVDYLSGGGAARSGVRVTPAAALTVSPVWQAIDVITSDVSRLPFLVYRETENGGRERAKTHPVYRILRRSVGEMTANLWVSRILAHALLYGNGYSRVIWRGNTVTALEFLHRDWVEPTRENGKLYYVVNYPATHVARTVRVAREDMFHLVGLTLDDLGGLSLIDFARHTIGRHIAAETFGDDFFANSAVPSGFFTHPGEMSEEAQRRFLAAVVQRHGSGGGRWRPAILEESMQYAPVGVSPTDALLIEQLKFGVMDVARYFNLPPHKLGDSSRVNYNSLEAEEKAYYGSSLGKWLSRFEFEANDKLFLDSEIENGYYVEFLQDSWLKADTTARFSAYAVAINWGIMSRNEVRARENLNPFDGGDEYLTPLTHQNAAPDTANALDADADNSQNIEDDTADEPVQIDPEQIRAALDAAAQQQEVLWSAARHVWRVCCRAATREANFLAFVNTLRIAQKKAVCDKLAETGTLSGEALTRAATTVFELVENAMLCAAECQPAELPHRVQHAEHTIRSACYTAAGEFIPQIARCSDGN